MEDQEQINKQLRDLIEIIQFTESVVTKIYGVLDEAEIYRRIGEGFARSKKYTVSILLLTDDGSVLRVVETAFSPRQWKAFKALQKKFGIPLPEYRLDLNKSSVCRQVVREGRTVVAGIREFMAGLFSPALVDLIVRRMDYERRTSIVTPLIRHGQIIGALAMISTGLTEQFVPSVKILAQHVSRALELADEDVRRTRAEKALQESKEALQALLNAITESVALISDKGTILTANETVAKRFETSVDKLVGSYLYDILPPELVTGRKAYVDQVLRTGRPVYFEDIRFGRYIDNHLYPVVDGKGKVTGVAVFGLDVTERKQMEETLRANEARYRAIVEDQTELVNRFLPDGTIAFVNGACCRFLGKKREELLGRHFTEPIPEEDRRRVEQAIASLTVENPVCVVENRLVTSNGEVRWLQWTNRALFDECGNLVEFQSVGRDITERRQAEAQLQQASRLASLAVLAGGIAHELRNPLGIISSCAQLQLERSEDAQIQAQCAQRMHAASRRASCIIENLLKFSNPGTGVVEEVDVQSVLEETVSLLTHHMTLQKVKLQKEFQPNLPKVYGHPELLQQVFVNLIVNACNAMPQGGGADGDRPDKQGERAGDPVS